jgi:o-succinylbenzoate---CoA ligase
MMKLSFKAYNLAFPKRLSTAQVGMDNRQGWRLILHSQDRILGLGEVAPWVGFGAGWDQVSEEVDRLSSDTKWHKQFETLSEKLVSDRSLTQSLSQSRSFSERLGVLEAHLSSILTSVMTPELRFGIELTLLDSISRAFRCPLSALLEPRTTLSTATHILVRNYAEAIEAARLGYRSIKVKVGINEHWVEELMDIARIRATLPNIEIRVDANQAWDAELAYGFSIAAYAFNISWVEEPCRSYTEHKLLLQKLEGVRHVKFGVDESLSQEEGEFERILADSSVSVVTLKPMFVGGLIRCAQLAIEAKEAGKQVCITHALGSWIERTATAHLVAALRPNILNLSAGLGGGLSDDIQSDMPVFGGELRLSTSAGIGDVDAVNVLGLPSTSRLQEPQSPILTRTVNQAQSIISIPHPLKTAVLARPEHCAVSSVYGSLTYRELAEYSVSLLIRLREKLGHRFVLSSCVSLSGYLSIDWVITYHALTGLGLSVAPLNIKLPIDEQRASIDRLKNTYHLQLNESQIIISEVIKDHGLREQIILNVRIPHHEKRSLSETLSTLEDWSWQRVVSMVSTSGTTGVPQVIPLTTSQVCLSAFGSAVRLGHQLDDVWLACLPPHHVGGLSTILRSTFYQITLHIVSPQAEALYQALDSVTLGSLTPALLADLLAVIKQKNTDKQARIPELKSEEKPNADSPSISLHIPKLRALLIGGGHTSSALWHEATSFGLPLRLTWGMSEAASQVCTQVHSEPPNTPIPPLPFVTVQSDKIQRLWVRGPLVTNGLIRSGDLGQVSDHGVVIFGRADDVIVSGGVNISPTEIEDILSLHPNIKEAAVIGEKHDKYGERPIAYLVSELETSQPKESEINQWCKRHLSAYKTPDRIVWVDELPRNPMGKLLRRVLKESETTYVKADLQADFQKTMDRTLVSTTQEEEVIYYGDTLESTDRKQSTITSRDLTNKKAVKYE